MEIKSVKPYNIDKVFDPKEKLFNTKEKQNIKTEMQEPSEYASSLEAMR